MNASARYCYVVPAGTLPAGVIEYAWDGRCCSRVWLCACSDLPQGDDAVRAWLDGYFTRNPVPLPPLANSTPFQQRLRAVLWAIPRGETRTYGEVAHLLHSSPRGVGQALAANRLPLLVPCHRVVSATGAGGFAFGLAWKQRLLSMERGVMMQQSGVILSRRG